MAGKDRTGKVVYSLGWKGQKEGKVVISLVGKDRKKVNCWEGLEKEGLTPVLQKKDRRKKGSLLSWLKRK